MIFSILNSSPVIDTSVSATAWHKSTEMIRRTTSSLFRRLDVLLLLRVEETLNRIQFTGEEGITHWSISAEFVVSFQDVLDWDVLDLFGAVHEVT